MKMNPPETIDMDLMAETELTRLQRQYRIMEGDRKAFTTEIKNKIVKQKKEIQILERERNELYDDYRVATCENQKKKDEKNRLTIKRLLDDYDTITEDNRRSKTQLGELRQQIRKFEKVVEKERLKQIPDKEYETRVRSANRTIQILENRLETYIKRFCATLSDNQKLRREIDHLLKERSRYNDIWDKLINKLNNDKRLMLDLIEQAITAYDQREEWCSKLQALKIRAHNDTINHTQEMREMQRQLDQFGTLKEFLLIKGQKRLNRDLEEKDLKRKEDTKLDLEKQQKILEETIEKIKVECEETDNRKIVPKYIKQEEENFALFNYINELTQELESLQTEISRLENQIEEHRVMNEKQKEQEQETIDSLNVKLEEATAAADAEKAKVDNEKAEFVLVLQEIKKIFDLLKCDSVPILELLKDNQIDNKNVLIYLGLIQKKISILFTENYFKNESIPKIRKGRLAA